MHWLFATRYLPGVVDVPDEEELEFVELLPEVPVLLLRELDDVFLLLLELVELVLRSLLLPELEFIRSVVEPVLGVELLELPAPGVPGVVLGEV